MAWPKGVPRKGQIVAPALPMPVVARRRPKDVRDMNRSELEKYALELGMMKRVVQLSDDRLRQNIKAFLFELFELYELA